MECGGAGSCEVLSTVHGRPVWLLVLGSIPKSVWIQADFSAEGMTSTDLLGKGTEDANEREVEDIGTLFCDLMKL